MGSPGSRKTSGVEVAVGRGGTTTLTMTLVVVGGVAVGATGTGTKTLTILVTTMGPLITLVTTTFLSLTLTTVGGQPGGVMTHGVTSHEQPSSSSSSPSCGGVSGAKNGRGCAATGGALIAC